MPGPLALRSPRAFTRRSVLPFSLALGLFVCFATLPQEAASLPLFGARTGFVTSSCPFSVAIADLNGDGRPDLVVPCECSNTVSVLLGAGDGSFGAKQDFATGNSPITVAVADFGGSHAPDFSKDGRLDLAVANYVGGTVSLLVGVGDGTFGTHVDYPMGANPWTVALGDLNGDGNPDLVTTNGGANTLSVRLGLGNAGFDFQKDYPTGGAPQSVAIADLNGDGKPDLALTNNADNTVLVLLGTGNGTFTAAGTYATAGAPVSLAVGDLNRDGKPDLAVACEYTNVVSVLLGAGDGSFAARTDFPTGAEPFSIAIGDLNADGALDLAIACQNDNVISILLGAGDGSFHADAGVPTESRPLFVAIGDLNGDLRPDLAVAEYGAQSVSVFLGRGGTPARNSLATNPNPSVYGQAVALTATVAPGDATGTVWFLDGTTTLGWAALTSGTATLSVSTLNAGAHLLTAVYGGDAVYFGSLSATDTQTVQVAGTSTTVESSLPTSTYGQTLSFTARICVTPPGGGLATGTVQFQVDQADFGSRAVVRGDTAVITTAGLVPVGSHRIQAVYSGDANVTGSSSPAASIVVLTPSPSIVAVRDVPNDQGGKVFLTWRSVLDQPGTKVVTGYRIWRRVPGPVSITGGSSAGDGAGAVGPAGPWRRLASRPAAPDSSIQETFWEAIAELPSAQLVSYGYTASTTQDSMAGSNPYTAYFVQALTADPFVFYDSAPDSGYSVDNLAPPTPAPFVAAYGGTANVLHWPASSAPDLREFRLHRGESVDFTPATSNLVAATRDTAYVDAPGKVFYKLMAVDAHGNISRIVTISPQGPVGTLASLLGVDALSDRIDLTWFTTGGPGLQATIYRRSGDEGWRPQATLSADGSGYLRYSDRAVAMGTRYGYRLGIVDGGQEVFVGEAWATAAIPVLRLAGARPNPARGGRLTIEFVLPSDEAARLELFDVNGRRLAATGVGGMGPGRHSVDLGQGARVSPGLYLVRLTQGSISKVARVVVFD